MKYIDPDIKMTRLLLSELSQKRLAQFKAFHIMIEKNENGQSLPNINDFIPIARNLSLNPLWTFWLNEHLKNNSFSLSDTSLLKLQNQVLNSRNISEWAVNLLSWNEYAYHFQTVCPPGYFVDIELNKTKWIDVLIEAFNMINDTSPELFNEMRLLISVIIPLKADKSVHPSFSFSARNRFGVIFLTFDCQPRVMADTLVHEFYHNRLNLLLEYDKILENADSDEYYSPWRKIPRPLWGILHGCFANYGIAKFWQGYLKKYLEISTVEREKIERGAIRTSVSLQIGCKSLLKHGKSTALGMVLINDLIMGGESLFDWACGLNSRLVAVYYNDYKMEFELWKKNNDKKEAIFENIF